LRHSRDRVVFGKSSEHNPNSCRFYHPMRKSREHEECCDVTFWQSGCSATSSPKKFLRNRNRTGAVFQWLYKGYEERFNLHESRISFNCYTGIIRHTSKLVFLIPVIKRSLQISCKKWKWRKFSENWQSIWHWMEHFKLNSGKTELAVGRCGQICHKPFLQLIVINLTSNKVATVKSTTVN